MTKNEWKYISNIIRDACWLTVKTSQPSLLKGADSDSNN